MVYVLYNRLFQGVFFGDHMEEVRFAVSALPLSPQRSTRPSVAASPFARRSANRSG
jgi:hypothetical protein